MKTNLPETRNRNLPPPPVAAVLGETRRSMMPPPPEEPRRGANAVRSFVGMVLIGGLLFGGIFFYIRGSQADMKLREQIFSQLESTGAEIWESSGMMASLHAETEEAKADLADLPRIVSAIKVLADKSKMKPRVLVLEGDLTPGLASATHQIQFLFDDYPKLVIRVRRDRESGVFSFVGVANRLVPSRQVLQDEAAKETPAPPPAETPPAAPPPAPEKVSPLPGNAP